MRNIVIISVLLFLVVMENQFRVSTYWELREENTVLRLQLEHLNFLTGRIMPSCFKGESEKEWKQIQGR